MERRVRTGTLHEAGLIKEATMRSGRRICIGWKFVLHIPGTLHYVEYRTVTWEEAIMRVRTRKVKELKARQLILDRQPDNPTAAMASTSRDTCNYCRECIVVRVKYGPYTYRVCSQYFVQLSVSGRRLANKIDLSTRVLDVVSLVHGERTSANPGAELKYIDINPHLEERDAWNPL